MKKEGKFTQIPNNLILSCNLTNSEFRTLAILLSYKFTNNTKVFPSQSSIAAFTGCSPRSIRNHMKSLKDKGFLKYERRGFNKTNEYIFLSDGKEYSSIKGKEFPPNNTKNKNTKNNNRKDISYEDKEKEVTDEELEMRRQKLDEIREKVFKKSKKLNKKD